MTQVQNDQELLQLVNSGISSTIQNDQELLQLVNKNSTSSIQNDQELSLIVEQRLLPPGKLVCVDQELLLLVVPRFAENTMITLQGGNFQNNEGQPLAYGYLSWHLGTDSVVLANPYGQVVSGITTRINLDIQGQAFGTSTFPISTVQVSNDVLLVTSTSNLSTVTSPGDTIVFPSSMTASFLSNQAVVVTSVQLVSSVWTMTALFQNSNYGPTSETSKNATVGLAQSIWSNAELNPAGTSYVVNAYNQAGTRVWSNPKLLVFTQSSGSVVNLSDILFSTNAPQVVYPGAVLLTPSGDQTIASNNLLPAASNTTQSLGLSSAPWNAVLNNLNILGTITVGKVPVIEFSDSQLNLTTNYNSGTAKTLVATPESGGLYRISGVQQIGQAATSSSTFPSLTLSYTDAGGIARTNTLVSTSTTNSTTITTAFNLTFNTNSSAAISLTSASYASSGATALKYNLTYSLEQLQ